MAQVVEKIDLGVMTRRLLTGVGIFSVIVLLAGGVYASRSITRQLQKPAVLATAANPGDPPQQSGMNLTQNLDPIAPGEIGFYALRRQENYVTAGVKQHLEQHYDANVNITGIGVVSAANSSLALRKHGASDRGVFDQLSVGQSYTLAFDFYRSAQPSDCTNSASDPYRAQRCYGTDGGWDSQTAQGHFGVNIRATTQNGAYEQPLCRNIAPTAGVVPSASATETQNCLVTQSGNVYHVAIAFTPQAALLNNPDADQGLTIVLQDGPGLQGVWFVNELNIDNVSLHRSGTSADPSNATDNFVVRFSQAGLGNALFNCATAGCIDWTVGSAVSPTNAFIEATRQTDAGDGHWNIFSHNYRDLANVGPNPITTPFRVRFNNTSDSPAYPLPGTFDTSLPARTLVYDGDATPYTTYGLNIFVRVQVKTTIDCGQTLHHEATGFDYLDQNGNFQWDGDAIDQRYYGDAPSGLTYRFDSNDSAGAVCTRVTLTSRVPNDATSCGNFYNSYYTADSTVQLQLGHVGEYSHYAYSSINDPSTFTNWTPLPNPGQENQCLNTFDLDTVLRGLNDELRRGENELFFRFAKSSTGAQASNIVSDKIVFAYPWVQSWLGDVHSNAFGSNVGIDGESSNVNYDQFAGNPPTDSDPARYNASFFVSSPGSNAISPVTGLPNFQTLNNDPTRYQTSNLPDNTNPAPDLGFPNRTNSNYFLGQIDFDRLRAESQRNGNIYYNGSCTLKGNATQSALVLNCTGDDVQIGGNRLVYIDNGTLTISSDATAILFKNGLPGAADMTRFGDVTFAVNGTIDIQSNITYENAAGLNDVGALASIAFLANDTIRIRPQVNVLVGVYYAGQKFETNAP